MCWTERFLASKPGYDTGLYKHLKHCICSDIPSDSKDNYILAQNAGRQREGFEPRSFETTERQSGTHTTQPNRYQERIQKKVAYIGIKDYPAEMVDSLIGQVITDISKKYNHYTNTAQ